MMGQDNIGQRMMGQDNMGQQRMMGQDNLGQNMMGRDMTMDVMGRNMMGQDRSSQMMSRNMMGHHMMDMANSQKSSEMMNSNNGRMGQRMMQQMQMERVPETYTSTRFFQKIHPENQFLYVQNIVGAEKIYSKI